MCSTGHKSLPNQSIQSGLIKNEQHASILANLVENSTSKMRLGPFDGILTTTITCTAAHNSPMRENDNDGDDFGAIRMGTFAK